MKYYISFLWIGCFLQLTFAKDLPSHPFQWEDMFSMTRVGSPFPSPDGKWIVFTQTQYDLKENKGNTDLAVISSDGKTFRQLTSQKSSDTNPRWLPDGQSIFFLSNRSGSSQIWKLPFQGGEAFPMTKLPVDIHGFKISPDGKKILFWASVFPDCSTLQCTADRLKEKEKELVKAKLFETLFIRHWDAWEDGRKNHLFVLSFDGGPPIDLMKGMDQDCPTKPFGGEQEFSWAPNGQSIVFTSKPSKGEAWHTNHELYWVDLQNPSQRKVLTSSNLAWDTAPAFSPDGTQLAYLAMDRPGYESDRFQIHLLDLKSQKQKNLTSSFDRSVEEMVWSKDGQTLYFTAADQARTKLFSLPLQQSKPIPLTKEGTVKSIQWTSEKNLVFLYSTQTRPGEIFSFHPLTQKLQPISQINTQKIQQVRMSPPEEFWFENEGLKIQGWLVKPVNFQKGKKYPLAFLIHGGPQGNWGDGFGYRWNPQFYAGNGYVVVGINFRGSTSFGQSFTDAIRGNWGPGPFSDLMSGLRFVLQNHSYIDSKRMCALGASFGGYMINWVAGQNHPFQCLINHDGDFDTTSSYFNTEELWFPEWDLMGTPWTAREVYERNSPMRNVQKWKTPMLVIHGAQDFRVVETEGFSTFNALQRLGIPSQFLYFPDENHWVSKPQNSRLWHQTVLNWLDRWTKTKR